MSVASTRRGFLAGAVAGAALPAVARAQTGAPAPGKLQAKQRIVFHGRAIAVGARGGLVVVAHERRRTVALVDPARGTTQLVDVGGQPVDVAVSPDGRVAAVTTGFWDKPGLAVVDMATGAVRTRVEVGPAPSGVAFTHSGKRLVVAGGEQEGRVHLLDTEGFAVVAAASIGIVPRGIAVEPGDRYAWIALNGDARIVRVDLRSGRVRRALGTPALPDRLALSPDGARLLVTHGGRDAEHVSEIEVRSGKVHRHYAGALPSGIAWTTQGHRLVALGGESVVVRLGAGRGHARRGVGAAPRGLAVAGRRAWTVSALTGDVSGVRL
jgi:DNA-binding beta-propeller fold protein YncE